VNVRKSVAVPFRAARPVTVPGRLAAGAEGPPRFAVAAPAAGKPLTLWCTATRRFSRREDIANSFAGGLDRSSASRVKAGGDPHGGDLVYQGSDPDDYATYRRETAAWSQLKIPVFPALGITSSGDARRQPPRLPRELVARLHRCP